MVKAKKVKGFECPECLEFYETEDMADECCPRDAPEAVERFQCGECEELYEDREDAKECCKED